MPLACSGGQVEKCTSRLWMQRTVQDVKASADWVLLSLYTAAFSREKGDSRSVGGSIFNQW